MRGTLNSIALLPLLLTQGLYTAARAPQLPEAAGPRSGAAGSGADLRLLIVGDSSAAGVGVDTQTQALSGQLVNVLSDVYRVHWAVRARSGATTATTLAALSEDPPDPCDVAVIALGVNDAKNGMRAAAWRRNYTALIRMLNRGGAAHVYASGLPPVGGFPILPRPLRNVLGTRAEIFDVILREVTTQNGAHHVPFDLPFDATLMAVDGFHPGPMVYTEWAKRIRDRVVRDLS